MALSNAERQRLHRHKVKTLLSNPLRNDDELKDALYRAYYKAYWRVHNPDFASCSHYQEGVSWMRRYIEKELGIDLGPYRVPGEGGSA
ncbi:hypothetical protein ORJ04_05935 [Rheinheimera baltica]|uniref:Uncharacterized protein n=1 Tax=Rheinheimera baltica TaxID=67576 RepID=A0ABT9HWI1_9GAMM|nr:hypothetical protein [Rheinheimera baltica]MDP5135487.1 hypothetical protein [Rheinheimera baltica]